MQDHVPTPAENQPHTDTPAAWRLRGKVDTGIHTIDRQHQDLLSLTGEIEMLHRTQQDAHILNEMLPQLRTYALFHFNEEEQLMHMWVGEDAWVQQHRLQHQDFIRQIEHLQELREFHSDRSTVEQLIAFLRDWLLHHIATTDRAMGAKMLSQLPGVAGH